MVRDDVEIMRMQAEAKLIEPVLMLMKSHTVGQIVRCDSYPFTWLEYQLSHLGSVKQKTIFLPLAYC
jgi:hypothetical protein